MDIIWINYLLQLNNVWIVIHKLLIAINAIITRHKKNFNVCLVLRIIFYMITILALHKVWKNWMIIVLFIQVKILVNVLNAIQGIFSQTLLQLMEAFQ